MKVGDLVVNKAYQNYSDIVPAKMVVELRNTDRNGTPYIILEGEPEKLQPSGSFFIVSPA